MTFFLQDLTLDDLEATDDEAAGFFWAGFLGVVLAGLEDLAEPLYSDPGLIMSCCPGCRLSDSRLLVFLISAEKASYFLAMPQRFSPGLTVWTIDPFGAETLGVALTAGFLGFAFSARF